MSMGANFDSDDELLTDINMTPLIDVMLVLLIIFIITLPIINQAVKVDLPKAEAQAIEQQTKSIDISVTEDGSILWDKQPTSDVQLKQKVAEAVQQDPLPVVRIYADQNVVYGRVAFVLTTAQQGGLSQIDFVMDASTPNTSPLPQ